MMDTRAIHVMTNILGMTGIRQPQNSKLHIKMQWTAHSQTMMDTRLIEDR